MEPKLTGYINANAGILSNASKDTITLATVGLGAKIENKAGYYVQAEGGYGNVTYVKGEVGKIHSLEKANLV